jgi:hypothetical protein
MMSRRSRSVSTLLLLAAASLLLLAALACDKRAEGERSDSASTTASTTSSLVVDAAESSPDAASRVSVAASERSEDAGPPPAFQGVVRGTVRLKKGARLPIAPPIVGDDGKAPLSVEPCPPIDIHDRRTIIADKKSAALFPVHLAVTGMSAAPTREPRVHELFIDGCRLRPTLVGALRGDKIRVTNRSPVALLPLLPGDKFMQALLRGESREFPVTSFGPNPVACGFSNYCGESSVITLSHPLYDVTAADGTFTIGNVPLDQELTIHAWHPLFEVTSATFKLSDQERAKSFELELMPSPSAASDGKAEATPKGARAKKSDAKSSDD